MSDREYRDHVSDINTAINYIVEFTSDLSFEEFYRDYKTQFAVIRCFEVMGEAVKRLPETFKNQHPSIPWKIVAGMRDRLIHGYDTVDTAVLWRTIKVDDPELLTQIKLLPEQ
jgi:uncharacterized protein with HEPN domain